MNLFGKIGCTELAKQVNVCYFAHIAIVFPSFIYVNYNIKDIRYVLAKIKTNLIHFKVEKQSFN